MPFPRLLAASRALCVQALLLAGAGVSLAPAAPVRDAGAAPVAGRVLIVTVDGLRPDVLLRAHTPALVGLMRRGSFTLWARTTPVAVTLPSHASLLTGVRPERHGIVWNDDRSNQPAVYPASPTLFDLAHAAGATTAMVAGKSKFSALARPGSLDWSSVPSRSSISDSAVADTAVRWIMTRRPRVLFVHLPGVDRVGHDDGWGSPGQLEAVAAADRCVARMLEALEQERLLDSTVVFVTADHGGAGTTHGAGDPRSLTIPWIVAGPGIRRDFDLASIRELDVRIEDTFTTACELLGLDPPPRLDGRVVRPALLRPARADGDVRGMRLR